MLAAQHLPADKEQQQRTKRKERTERDGEKEEAEGREISNKRKSKLEN